MSVYTSRERKAMNVIYRVREYDVGEMDAMDINKTVVKKTDLAHKYTNRAAADLVAKDLNAKIKRDGLFYVVVRL